MGISPNLKMNWLDIEVKRSKGQGHNKTTYGQLRTLGGIFSTISVMHGSNSSHYSIAGHSTWHRWRCQAQGFKGQSHRQYFPFW